MKARIKYRDGRTEIIENLSEIHYNYGNTTKERKNRIAFESDIDKTGFTEDINAIIEFEVFNDSKNL